MQTRTVVVIGGGFAGWSVINHLQQYNPKRTQIILVDNKEYFENTPGLPYYLVHRTHHDHDSSEIHFAHSTHLSGNSQLVCGDVTEVTSEEVVVVRQSRNRGQETARLRYDCLVICSGRKYRSIDLEDRTLSARLKYINSQREIIKRAETLLVVGGGPAGVELAAELACKHQDKSVTMMHRGNSLIARTCGASSAYADTVLRSMKVHIVYKKESNLVDRNTTSSLPVMAPHIYDKVFACIGGSPNTRFMRANFANHLDEHGAIMVNRFFQLEGFPNIFAIGDVTALSEEKTAERAMVHGEWVAQHVRAILKKKSMGEKGYIARSNPFMQVISLGPDNGIALLAGDQIAVGPIVPKMKREFIKTCFATLISKLVTNKRHSLYGLTSKTPPTPPPATQTNTSHTSTLSKADDVPQLEFHKNNKILCCFNFQESEPNLTITSTSNPNSNSNTPQASPRTSPREGGLTMKRRALRSMSSAVGLVDVTEMQEDALDSLNPRALVLGADNSIAKLLIEALAHTGMRTRAAVHMHTWITQSASYKLSYSMLIHNVECVDYNTKEEQSLDALLEGIQVLLLPVGITDTTQIFALMSKLTKLKSLKCVIYVRLIDENDLSSPNLNDIEEMIRAYNLPGVVIRHAVTMQSVRDVIGRQVHCFRAIVWPEHASSSYFIDQRDLCTALAMIFHEPSRHVGKVYHLLGPELLSGVNVAHILSSMVGEEITFIEASHERLTDYLLRQGFTEEEAQLWLQKISAPTLPNRPLDLDMILDTRPTTLSKWLLNNIYSLSDIWTTMTSPGPSRHNRKSRPRSASLRKSEAPTLFEVLSDKILSRKFLEFLQSEFCAENYLFWHSVEKFREITNVDEMIAAAIEISNQYIYEGGPSPINIDQKLRVTILSNMRMGLSKDIFDLAQEKVLRLMEMEAYPRFAKTAGLLPKTKSGMLRARSAGHVEPITQSSELVS